MSLPQGSRITIRAAANKELVRMQVDAAADEKTALPPLLIESKDLSPDRRGFNYTAPVAG